MSGKNYGSDPKLPFGSRRCLCSGCGEYFSNVRNFDMHRTGEGKGRSCIHPSKLVTKKGKARLRLNADGIWVRPDPAYLGNQK